MNLSSVESQMGTLDEIQHRLEAVGDGGVFQWVEETYGLMKSRASNHNKEVCAWQIAKGPMQVDSMRGPSPWALLIDGDLEAAGDLDFSTDTYDTSILIVLGNVKARNFRFSGGARSYVSGRMNLAGICVGDHGDESAELYTNRLTARALVLDHVTGVNAEHIDAVVCCSEGWGLTLMRQ